MLEFTQLLQRLDAITSATARKSILNEYIGHDGVRRLLIDALSSARVFNVKKVAGPSAISKNDNGDYQAVLSLLDELDAGLKGNAAKAAVDRVLVQYSSDQQDAIIRVLTKQLRAGIDASTVNEVAPGLIPVFPIALAKKFKGDSSKIEFPIWADIKYDGYRTVAKVYRDSVRYFSREGREGDKYKGWFDSELIHLRNKIGHDIAVDGEALGKDFSSTQQARGTDGDEHIGQMRLFVFTILPLSVFESMARTDDELTRIGFKTSRLVGYERLVHSEGRLCDTFEALQEMYAYALSKKYEGLILKKPRAPYAFRRSDDWQKWKPVMSDLDGQVIDVFEGEAGSALEGNMGGVVVRGTTEDGDVFQCRIGSGFDLKTRTQWWADHTGKPQSYTTFKDGIPQVHVCVPSGRPVVSRWIEMEGQELTRSLDRADGALSVRFPVFKRERDPK